MNWWETVIFVILGSGSGTAIVGWVIEWNKQKTVYKRDFREKQIRNVYGPVYFRFLVNRMIWDHLGVISKASKEAWAERAQWAIPTQEKTDQMMKDVNVHNAYIYKVIENNRIILKVLEDSWYWIDVQDIPIFEEFIKMIIRLQLECDDKINSRFTNEVNKRMPNIQYFDQNTYKSINDVYRRKWDELKMLGG